MTNDTHVDVVSAAECESMRERAAAGATPREIARYVEWAQRTIGDHVYGRCSHADESVRAASNADSAVGRDCPLCGATISNNLPTHLVADCPAADAEDGGELA
jgi:hypothetical protein